MTAVITPGEVRALYELLFRAPARIRVLDATETRALAVLTAELRRALEPTRSADGCAITARPVVVDVWHPPPAPPMPAAP